MRQIKNVITATAMLAMLSASAVAQQVAYDIYDDALAPGWGSPWLNGWSSTYNIANTTPVYSGTKSISMDLQSGGGRGPFNSAGFDTSGYDSLSLWINGGATGNQVLNLQVVKGTSVQQTLMNFVPSLPANTWVNFTVPLSAVGVANITNFGGIRFTDGTQDCQGVATFYVDKIQLTPVPEPSAAALAALGMLCASFIMRRRNA